jgi:alkanesulfonate monooxygenase SsuD/methylene tetrahydromethanopterin reductase-like flavin-dependent oxidoreductase (luciferase family)
VDFLRQVAKEKFGRDPSHLKMIAGITIIVDETDEKAYQKRDELLKYGDREGALALFGGWTGIDLSTYSDDEDFKFVGLPAIQSMVKRWADTVPGSEGLKWTKSRIADFLLLGGVMPKIIGSAKTVVDELERWVEEGDVDGFNLSHIVNPGSFEDMIEFLLPELQRRGLFNPKVKVEGATARERFLGQPHLLDDHPGSQYKWTT